MDGSSGGNFLEVGSVLAFLVVGLISFVLWIWSIVDAVRFSDEQWRRASQNKFLWIVLVVILGLLGSLLYVLVPRPTLKRTRSSGG
jgi:hypothetical protein